MWIFIALGSSLFYGFANVLDNFLTNRLFKNIWTLVIFGLCIDMLLVPVVMLISPPHLPPLNLVPYILLVGFLEVAYLFPYYRALQEDDTSVVSSLFAIGRIFIPIFAFLFVGEILQTTQYFGFLIIVLSSTLLTMKDVRHFKLNKSFYLMLLVALILSFDTVIYKYILNNLDWSTAFVSVLFTSWAFSLFLLLIPKIRKDALRHLREARSSFKFLALEEVMALTANAAGTFVLSLVPITIARGFSAIIPFVVLLYGAVLQKFFPKFFHENVSRNNIIKKIILFVMTMIGIYLIVE